MKKNIGIAGWNEGAKKANGEYLLFLDDDSYPLQTTLSAVIGKNLDINTVYALDIRTADGNTYAPYLQHEQPLHTFIGCGVLMSKYIFELTGQFNASLFLYCHETEFCLRAYQKGAKVRFVPNAIVVHVASQLNRRGDGNYKIDQRRTYYINRNIVFILFTYFPFWCILGRVIRFILGRLIFAICHGTGWITIKGSIVGMCLAFQQRHNRIIINTDIRQLYGNGKYFASFFGDGTYAFQRPQWL